MEGIGRRATGPGRVYRYGEVDFLHYDFYGQALAKVERGHHTDLGDVDAMVTRGLIDVDTLVRLFEGVTHDLLRYPAIDEQALRAKLAAMVERAQGNAQGD